MGGGASEPKPLPLLDSLQPKPLPLVDAPSLSPSPLWGRSGSRCPATPDGVGEGAKANTLYEDAANRAARDPGRGWGGGINAPTSTMHPHPNPPP